MKKYSNPQIFVVNNEKVAKKMGERYIVETGDLGTRKIVDYQDKNERLVNFDYKLIRNLHEYKVRIIDLQEEMTEVTSDIDEAPIVDKPLFKLNFPKKVFDPKPMALHLLCKEADKNNLTIIFAGDEYTEEYELVEMTGHHSHTTVGKHSYNTYSMIHAVPQSKEGRILKYEENNLSTIIKKFATGYKVIFDLPKGYDRDYRKSVINRNYIPLMKNQENEIISYIGYDENTGYELLLPECDNKDQLMEELFSKVLPELLPQMFPESREYSWISNNYYKHRDVIQYEREIQKITTRYEEELKTVNEKIEQNKIKNMFLPNLLTESGEKLIEAVKEYLEWLEFENVSIIDKKDNDVLMEDIQVSTENELFIIHIQGLEGTPTDSDCAQIAKNRRRIERENVSKNVIPLYIVNHQRYINPIQRENPPFTQEQIDYAKSDERGLLTTWDLFKRYRVVNEGVFTKEEIRASFLEQGLMRLQPLDMQYIGKVDEYFSKQNACMVNLEGIEISLDEEVYCNKKDIWFKSKIVSLQQNGQSIENAQNDKAEIILDKKIGKGYSFYKKMK
jgi:hypothetical protein